MGETKALAIMPTSDEWSQMKEVGALALKSGLLPTSIKSPEAATIIILKGRELGLQPMVALSHINVIQGKPTMSAEIMLAYIYKEHPNAEIDIAEKSPNKCVLEVKRTKDRKVQKFTWDMERAKKMGLAGKDNWIKQPETMLFWRCITEMKRAIFPEVLMGVDYAPEELEDLKDVTPRDAQPVTQTVQDVPVKTVKNFAPQTPEEAAKINKEIAAKKEAEAKEKAAQEKELADDEMPAREDLVAAILKCAKDQKMDMKALGEYTQAQFGKAGNDLTTEELVQLFALLENKKKEEGK